jgi:hypothetical protein
MSLWYFETVSMTGRWSPCTAPEKPEIVNIGGHEREKRVSGIGPRIRRIVQVPEGLRDLALSELQRHLWGESEETAVGIQTASPHGMAEIDVMQALALDDVPARHPVTRGIE